MVDIASLVPPGSGSGLSYIVRYDEDSFLALNAEDQETFRQTVLADAIKNGSDVACIQLIPDELLSTTGAPRPYIGWQQRTMIAKPSPYPDKATAARALATLVKAGKATKVDYIYVPVALACAITDFLNA